MERIRILIEKEFIQVMRDRRALIIMLSLPLLYLFLLGYGAVTQVRHIPLAVLDHDGTPRSGEFVERLVNSTYFDLKLYVNDDAALRAAVDGNKARAAVVIPAGFSESLYRNEGTSVQLVVDGTDPSSSASALYAFTAIAQAESTRIQVQSTGRGPALRAYTKVWYNPNLRDIMFNVPGLIGAIMLQITVTTASQAIVRERERGTMERLISSPLRPYELLLGKLVPYALISLWDLLIILVFAVYWFNVPIVGSFLQLLLVGILYIVICLGFGLLISTVSFTQQQAVQLSVMMVLPSMILSGFIYPLDAMPRTIQVIAYATPLRYFIPIARGIILKGAPISQFLPELWQMTLLGVIVMGLSIVRFTRKFA